ncbi:hypothetical protein QTP88_007158 [Uroleucon formosanum]
MSSSINTSTSTSASSSSSASSSTTNASTSTNASASTSTSTSASASGKAKQAQGLQLLLEASMQPILKQPNDSELEIEKVATELSVAMKTGNGKSVKETASKLHALHEKFKKENTENDNSAWNDIIRCAIDNDLQCNICFEIFIKPTVLNCSHTFCESCIHVWTKRVKKCPICRMHIKSKSHCLILDSFIEKIVEQLPKEIKYKRGVTIKDRNKKMKLEKSRSNIALNTIDFESGGIDLMSLLGLDEVMDEDTPHFFDADDIDEDAIIEEAEIFRMNLHDTVVNTRGVNPLMSYITDPEEQTSSGFRTRPRNSSARR